MIHKDFIIVGQGLAGTLLAHFLKEAGKRVLLLDREAGETASQVAAGIINPVTGRRFVKSWMIETLLPFAKTTYRSLENLLNISIYHEKPILRALSNPGQENDWLARVMEPGYAAYMAEKSNPGTYPKNLHPVYAFGETMESAQVDLKTLIEAYRAVYRAEGAYEVESFDYDALRLSDAGVQYKNWSATGIIFCEGYGMKGNPYFNDLPMRGDKGQVLHVHIANAGFEKMYKDQIFIVPFTNKTYWIGATYEPRFQHEGPTTEGANFLSAQLAESLKLPFEIMAHKAAVRPTVKDRRPLLGTHPDFKQVHLFNGLGTKGASLGPYWAHQMTEYLLGRSEIDPLVDIRRFY